MQPGSAAVTSGAYRGDPASVKMVQSDFMQGAMAASNGGHMLSHAHQWVTALPHAAAAAAAAAVEASSPWSGSAVGMAGSPQQPPPPPPQGPDVKGSAGREDLHAGTALHHRGPPHLGPPPPPHQGHPGAGGRRRRRRRCRRRRRRRASPVHGRRPAAAAAESALLAARGLHGERHAERAPGPRGRRRRGRRGGRRRAEPGAPGAGARGHARVGRAPSPPSPPRAPAPAAPAPRAGAPPPRRRRRRGARTQQPRSALGRGHADVRRPGAVRQAVQAAAHQAGLHAGRRGAGTGHPVRQRVLADYHLPLRGPAAELQEHVQAQTVAQQVAGGGGLEHRQPHEHRQDRGAGPQAQEADLHRGERQGRTGEPLPQVPQALCAGDHKPGRQPAAREGGGTGVVLQPEAEGEAHDAARDPAADARRRVLAGGPGECRHAAAAPRAADKRAVKARAPPLSPRRPRCAGPGWAALPSAQRQVCPPSGERRGAHRGDAV
uniref:Uncharacterized protein n=1 Tax=Bos mutus grunniens TaxID=30521 RepID=A0A8B9WSS4_BOSMU